MLVSVFIALSLAATAVTLLTIREDIPVLIGGLMAALMSAVAGLNALELFVIANNGGKTVIDPEVDLALVLLFVFLINVVFIFEKAIGEIR